MSVQTGNGRNQPEKLLMADPIKKSFHAVDNMEDKQPHPAVDNLGDKQPHPVVYNMEDKQPHPIVDNMEDKQLQPVVADIYLQPVQLEDAYVANIADRKLVAGIMRQLAVLSPLGDLQHLKRVRSRPGQEGPLQIVLCKATVQGHAALSANIQGLGSPYLVKVPACAPLTRQQYNQAVQYWPVNFHENKDLASILSGSHLSSRQLADVQYFTRQAIRLAQIAGQKQQKSIGAVIVEPVSRTVVAEAYDLRQAGYPLQHAVMVAIDLVAQSQGGGMWTYAENHPDIKCTRPETNSPATESPYLCTGYDLYVTQEPCVMCSMALVHARIGRVFYGSPHPAGALGSRYKLHCQQGLNHHYSVFRGCLQSETDKLYNSDG